MKCIYRGVELNQNSPSDSDTASAEHIIPWALGGSNSLVTNDASEKGNNDLGSKVDAPFANTLPLAFMRHRLQIPGYGGSIPPIVWHGVTPDGDPAKFIINSDGTTEADIGVRVDRPPQGQSGRVVVKGDHDKVVSVLSGMLKGMKKRGERAYSQDGKLLESLDDFLSASEQTLIESIKVKVEQFNKEAWGRGILKIVLSLGHHLLGPEWSNGNAAELIRQFVMNDQMNWPSIAPRGYIAGEWDRSFRLALGKTSEVRESLTHTVAILPGTTDGKAIALVSLFGGNNVPESVVDIGYLPKTFMAKLNAKLNDSTVLGYRVDPKSRKVTPIPLAEIDERNRKLGPTNKKSVYLHLDQLLT